MAEKIESKAGSSIIDLARTMERIISQQRQMSHYLMLLQEEAEADGRFAALEDAMRDFTTELERLDETLNRLIAPPS